LAQGGQDYRVALLSLGVSIQLLASLLDLTQSKRFGQSANEMTEQLDCPLCCLGTFPFCVWVVSVIGAIVSIVVEAGSISILRALKLLEVCSIGTAIVGIVVLRMRRSAGTVPRGCDQWCSCAFLPWSLLLQLLDIVAMVPALIENEADDEEQKGVMIGLVALRFVAVALDVTFGVFWLVALKGQDEDICCGASRRNTGSTQVGQPTAVGTVVVGEAKATEAEIVTGEAVLKEMEKKV